MKTAFHYLLVNCHFDTIRKFAYSIKENDIFKKFLENENLINKIKEIFELILEEHTRYPLDAIETRYCMLPVDYDYFDYDEEDDETPEEKSNREVRSKVKFYLNAVVQTFKK